MAQLEPYKDTIEQAGAQLVFIAAQKRGGFFNAEKFLEQHPIGFPFLLDEDRTVTKAFGVHHLIGLDAFDIAHPATFVVGRDGRVKFAYVGDNQLDRAPLEEVLAALKRSRR